MTDWANLLDEHGPTMYRVAHRLLGRPEDAEDCVHDVFLEVIAMANHSRVRTWPAFLIWMTTVRSLDRLRQTRHVSIHESAETPRPAGCLEDGLERAELLEWIRCAVACLPTRRREVFSLRYFAELTYDQIAELLDLEAPTVGVTLREARQQLRRWLPTRSKQDLGKGASP
ncbi:MAG: RNA polymerase sigma factor [Planctomycetota bacterium]|jgi:RNA polymerase sigma-70 factor (ECF subfamily)